MDVHVYCQVSELRQLCWTVESILENGVTVGVSDGMSGVQSVLLGEEIKVL